MMCPRELRHRNLNHPVRKMDALDHVLAMVGYYRSKLEDGRLTGSEAAVYLKCLTILGVTNDVMSSRNVEKLAMAEEALELPFPSVVG